MGDTQPTQLRSGNVSPLVQRWGETLTELRPASGEPGWLAEIRTRAADAFRRNGLPGNKDEAWKYTSLRRLEELDPDLGGTDPASAGHDAGPPLPGLAGFGFRWSGGRIDFRDTPAPEGVTIEHVEDALAGGNEPVKDQLKSLFESIEFGSRARAFEALNTALPGPGVVIHVAAGVDAGRCVAEWDLPLAAESGMHNPRLYVVLEAGARLELIEQHGGEPARSGSAHRDVAQGLNLLFRAELSEAAVLQHVRIQNEDNDGIVLTFAGVRQAASSRYRFSGFDTGGGLVRHAIECFLQGPGAQAEVQGAFVTDGERHVDYHVCIDHQAADCSSDQFFRGVLGGHSRGVFNGKAVIRAGADGASVRQSNANLLLSREAEIDTKPELEIHADEVEASHGATVGQLDENAVFYLRSRGLSEAAARRILTTAFCRAVADRLDDPGMSEAVAGLLERAMPREMPETAPEK
ncbi:Fe-S cluster assembly protein SufD [Elongatibacter sediminis]|uniref:Fe-S cluster assembly protein SufD n=1 Tax=Elongatibacter sediminis TaxID=3119006 RepID=A0AAW9R9L2_9GAMM